ncbi:MAG: cupin domain-containing protein [Bacteroidetes bacterium]|nr:cupin domain-containing protein [Bacteroidota bacterium]MBU1580537.1 cupin domain-containing protein [Bacteroidota bacterium]MBU2557790.1 cupin domain-containing protein [Bacteroidota bacterium]
MELQGKFRFEELAQTAPNAIVSKQIIKNEKGNITLFAFDQNEGLSEHTAPFDALVMIIEGEAMVSIGGENHQLAAGDSIIMPANVPHALKAEKAFKMILVMIKA